MRIVVTGIGEVGTHLASMLAHRYHEVVAIDADSASLERLLRLADVETHEGSAISLEVLASAGVGRADLFVAVAPLEETNIISSLLAKRLGAKRVVARIDSNEYLKPATQGLFEEMGIDSFIYPEKLASQVIIGMLGEGGTLEYMGFGDGSLSLSSFRIPGGQWMVGRTLEEIDQRYATIDFRVVAVTRAGETLIARGDTRLYEQDMVYVISTPRGIARWRSLLGESRFKVDHVMVVGASRMGVRTCLDLEGRVKSIKLVEINKAKCEYVSSVCEKTLVLHGDGRDTDLLLREGLERMDAFVSVTGSAETNILTSMAAQRAGVKQVITEVENFDYIALAESIGLDAVINKKLITASRIFRYTMGEHLASIRYLSGTDAEVAEFIAKEGSMATRGRLKDLHFPSQAVVGGIFRGGQSFIALGDTQIMAGDRVVVFAMASSMDRLKRFFG